MHCTAHALHASCLDESFRDDIESDDLPIFKLPYCSCSDCIHLVMSHQRGVKFGYALKPTEKVDVDAQSFCPFTKFKHLGEVFRSAPKSLSHRRVKGQALLQCCQAHINDIHVLGPIYSSIYQRSRR